VDQHLEVLACADSSASAQKRRRTAQTEVSTAVLGERVAHREALDCRGTVYLVDVCACERKPISLAPGAAVRGVPAWLERWEWQRLRGLARPEVPAASCKVQVSYAAVQGAPDYGLPRQHSPGSRCFDYHVVGV
jgi:hypothetical protein